MRLALLALSACNPAAVGGAASTKVGAAGDEWTEYACESEDGAWGGNIGERDVAPPVIAYFIQSDGAASRSVDYLSIMADGTVLLNGDDSNTTDCILWVRE